jgi:hypothetical protein
MKQLKSIKYIFEYYTLHEVFRDDLVIYPFNTEGPIKNGDKILATFRERNP